MAGLFGKIRNRFFRYSLVTVLVIIVVAGLIIAFTSPIAKYLIEKYSEKYTGRKIELSWIYINPFTGNFHIHNLNIHENKSPDPFLKARDVSANVSLPKLRHGIIDISSIVLNEVWMNIVQTKSHINWEGFFTPDPNKPKKPSGKPLEYYFRDIVLINSEVHYSETTIPVNYKVTKLNVTCKAIRWDSDTSAFRYSFNFLDHSGQIAGLFSMNFKNADFKLATLLYRLDLKTMEQYIREFANYGYFSAFLDADMKAKGNFKDSRNIETSGKFRIVDFHFGKDSTEDYMRFSKLEVGIDTMSPMNKKYYFKKVKLDSAFVKYERYDSLDNFTRMVGMKGENISKAHAEHAKENIIFQMAKYISEVARDIIRSDYRVDDFSIANTHAIYNDYSLESRFSASIEPIVITASHIDTHEKNVDFKVYIKINPFGDIHVNWNVEPVNLSNFVLTYDVSNLPIPFFNPYAVTYTAYPFDRGWLRLNGNWVVQDKQVNSVNHLLITNPTLARRVDKEDAKRMPMRVVMFVIRDINREMDYTVPVSGNLNDPNYHVWKAILQALENVLVKPPAFPYIQFKRAVTDSETGDVILEWPLGQASLNHNQELALRKVRNYLLLHPGKDITITPRYFEVKEKEMLLLFEAKRKYFASHYKVKESDMGPKEQEQIDKMSIRERGFQSFINQVPGAKGLYSTEAKCQLLVGEGAVEKLYEKLNEDRRQLVQDYFNKWNKSGRVWFKKGESIIPATGFSHYRIHYRE